MFIFSPFSKTTEPIVNQKNVPGHVDESNIAMATVPMKTITSASMLYTMRGVRLPLKESENIKKHN